MDEIRAKLNEEKGGIDTQKLIKGVEDAETKEESTEGDTEDEAPIVNDDAEFCPSEKVIAESADTPFHMVLRKRTPKRTFAESEDEDRLDQKDEIAVFNPAPPLKKRQLSSPASRSIECLSK